MNQAEQVLIAIIEANTKDRAILYLEYYIQRNGFLSDEAGDIVRKLLEEKE